MFDCLHSCKQENKIIYCNQWASAFKYYLKQILLTRFQCRSERNPQTHTKRKIEYKAKHTPCNRSLIKLSLVKSQILMFFKYMSVICFKKFREDAYAKERNY